MQDILNELRIQKINSGAFNGKWIVKPSGGELESISPISGELIAKVQMAGADDYDKIAAAAKKSFEEWRTIPAPKRGEVIRLIGEELRRHKEALGRLVTLEMGKILAEGIGEVQEMIDICDFAVGLSRQLYGLSMHSERPSHRMYEQWHPLGPIGVITAFNFPVAVWSWNAAIAAVCGDPVIWKPSSKTPLTGIAVQHIVNEVTAAQGVPPVFFLAIGAGKDVGEKMILDPSLPLISATGSTAMGKRIAQVVATRLGRTLLELGGNNAILVTEGADLDLAVRAVLFGAVGTAGQRCTTTRRLLLHRPIAKQVTQSLVAAYGQVKIGDPLKEGTLMGPLVDEQAVQTMMEAIKTIKEQGGEIIFGGGVAPNMPSKCYVQPTLVKAPANMPIIQDETFAPILYLIEGENIEELIQTQNNVPQGLSSAMFTNNLQYSERFLSAAGSDCGIANINIGTSGAEIGGAFGGEKETGGGRESGSDSWKAYMRRQTVTVNWGKELPLAQGIKFGD
ncbi:MAG: aldehyde dehydrogenase family protein [Pseudomonadota bacterium]